MVAHQLTNACKHRCFTSDTNIQYCWPCYKNLSQEQLSVYHQLPLTVAGNAPTPVFAA